MRIIKCEKLTSLELLQEAASSTTGKPSGMSLKRAYESGHSIIRTQLFWIEMEIPSFLSVHLVRHKCGVEHFVRSLREDRGGPPPETVTRETPVRHSMLINAEALIGIAHKRLCTKAHRKARFLLTMLRQRLIHVDADLAANMVPLCVYRGGLCGEFGPCKRREAYKSIQEAATKLISTELDSPTTLDPIDDCCAGLDALNESQSQDQWDDYIRHLNRPSLTDAPLPGLGPIDEPRLGIKIDALDRPCFGCQIDVLNTGERS